MATYIGGKAAYVIITSVLLLGIPYALAMEEDRVLGEQERQMQLQQGMSEVLAPTAAGTLAEVAPESQPKPPVRPPGF